METAKKTLRTVLLTLTIWMVLCFAAASAMAQSVTHVHMTVDGNALTERANRMGSRQCRNRSTNTWRISIWDANSREIRSGAGQALDTDMPVSNSMTTFAVIVSSGSCRMTWNAVESGSGNGFISIQINGRELVSRRQPVMNESTSIEYFMVAIPTRPTSDTIIVARR